MPRLPIHTVGHSTLALDDFIAILSAAGVELIADVRSFPRSRRNPQFNSDTLPAALAGAGIGYQHLPALGGRRGRQHLDRPSPNGHWQNDSFRNYADYALTPAFADGLAEVLRLAEEKSLALLCAEAAWQQCHRQLIADHLIASGEEVRHIIRGGRIEAAVLNPAAVRAPDGQLIYPPPPTLL